MMRSILGQLQSVVPFTSYRYKGRRIACDVCGSDETKPVCDYDRRLKLLKTVSCGHCGLVRTDPMPTDTELARYYATTYRRDYQWTSTPPRAHLSRSRREAAARLASLAPRMKSKSRVLDVGCGAGEFLAAAGRAGHQGVGLEPGQGFANYARTANGLEVHELGWETASFAKGSFDVITLYHVLEHLREPTKALRKLHGWLADDGILYLAVPNLLVNRDQAFLHFHFAHVYSFTPRTLIIAAKVAGFEPDPAIAPRGTAIAFRKRAAGPLPRAQVARHCDGFNKRFQTPRPVTYLVSFRWLAPALGRLRKGLRDRRISIA